MTIQSTSYQRCGAESLGSLQGDSVPGSVPRQSPPKATGGHSFKNTKRRRTGFNKPMMRKVKQQHFTVMHWNAEGVFNKKAELEHTLHEENKCLLHTRNSPSTNKIL
ncbi:hypothetical protein DPMN_194939 [Dreissena polymorpha]|uniref:Uncharacterized protein n=1 Tax=Dreissena polymorpha TaxID=45954 RepID=A0A9D3Y1R2_DREPO|nr:hypothetical protein DPMN_194939 [Dreissena polymorpha]